MIFSKIFIMLSVGIVLSSVAMAEEKKPIAIKPVSKPIWDSSWSKCKSDDNCSSMQGACGNWVGVSTLGKAPAYDFLLNESLSAKCKEYKMFPAPKIICQKTAKASDGQCMSEREAQTTKKED